MKTRAEEKAEARKADAEALENGSMTQEELAKKNGIFALPGARIDWANVARPRKR